MIINHPLKVILNLFKGGHLLKHNSLIKKGGERLMHKWLSWAILIIGLILLGQDLGLWRFWTISPWTIIFLLVGLWKLGHDGFPMKKKKK